MNLKSESAFRFTVPPRTEKSSPVHQKRDWGGPNVGIVVTYGHYRTFMVEQFASLES